MAHPRRFRFGIQLSAAASAQEWAEQACKAEDLGYSTLFMPDHFGDQLAPVPAMMAAADATTDLKIGTLVFDNDYKHPVVLAKELATLDVLSGGRVEVGLGAGWMKSYPHACIGTVEQICEDLQARRERWDVSYFVFQGDTMDPLAPVVAALSGT